MTPELDAHSSNSGRTLLRKAESQKIVVVNQNEYNQTARVTILSCSKQNITKVVLKLKTKFSKVDQSQE